MKYLNLLFTNLRYSGVFSGQTIGDETDNGVSGQKEIYSRDIWKKLAFRMNHLLERVLENRIELVKPGNAAGQDGNWSLTVNSDGDLITEVRENGEWVKRGPKVKAS